jgi:hypothetical protein
MLRFAVFDDDGPAGDWPMVGCHLIGPEDLPARGAIRFRRGYVECEQRGSQAVGLCLQHHVPGIGSLMLQTCLLPRREEPYVLNVEITRHCIKTFIAKCEEWQMFDIGPDHPAVQHWEQARQIFTQALTAPMPGEANRKAAAALSHAIQATERLALAHADLLLRRRFGQRPAFPTTLGVRICPERESAPLREIVGRDFDVVQIPLRWKSLEVEEGRYDWEPVDRWVQWARANGKPIVAGPLLDFSGRSLPEWMHVWQHDYDTCRDLAYDHVERVVERYSQAISVWNVASGLNVNDNFEFTPEQMIDLTRMAALVVRQSRKGARVMVELREPFGEHSAARRGTLPPGTYLDRLIQEGIRLDAVGVQLLFGRHDRGQAVRDLMQISSMLDRFFLLELPVVISAMGVPSESIDPQGGWWLARWSPELQARWGAHLFAIALSKPHIETIFWSDLYDHDDADLAASGLITADGRTRPVLQRLIALRKRLRKPLLSMGVGSRDNTGRGS